MHFLCVCGTYNEEKCCQPAVCRKINTFPEDQCFFWRIASEQISGTFFSKLKTWFDKQKLKRLIFIIFGRLSVLLMFLSNIRQRVRESFTTIEPLCGTVKCDCSYLSLQKKRSAEDCVSVTFPYFKGLTLKTVSYSAISRFQYCLWCYMDILSKGRSCY